MPVGLERFVRVMTGGHGTTDNLVRIRNGKTSDAIQAITAVLVDAANQGFGLQALKADRERLEKARLTAMGLNTNKAKCDALDPVKTEARTIAKDAPRLAEVTVTDGKQTLLEMRMAESWCIKYIEYSNNGLPDKYIKNEDDDPKTDMDLNYLVDPSRSTIELIKTVRREMMTDAKAANQSWKSGKGIFYDTQVRFNKDVLRPFLRGQVEDLIEENPDGPEAKMKKALGSKFETTLLKVVETAESFGVDTSELSLGQQVAIHTYTSQDYKDINGYLNGIEPKVPYTKQKKEEIETKIEQTAAALKSLSPYVGITTRGENAWPGSEERYVVGKQFTVAAFWSTGIGFKFLGKYQITVDGKSGRNIQSFSMSPNEAEILFAPGTKFKVVSRVEDESGTVKVKVEEV